MIPRSFAALPLRDGARMRSAAPPDREAWLSPEGIAVQPFYAIDDLAGLDALDTYPGLPPFLRGPYPTMYTTQPWTVRQYAGYSTAAESNAFYRRNLAAGQKGLSVAFDWPPTGATTRIIPESPATSEWREWPSIRSWTCGSCSTASPSARSACR